MFQELPNWFLVFTRLGALLIAMPVFSTQAVSPRLRLSLAALLSVLILPSLPPLDLSTISLWKLLGLFFCEVSVGLLLGFICRFIFFALDVAGAVIAAEMGLTLPAEFNQFTGSTSMAPAVILYWLGAIFFFSLDLHHWMIVGLQRSYALVPIGGAHLSEALLLDVVARSSKVFFIALQISAPMMAASFMVGLVFSVLSRAVPQMNVFAESYPVRTFVGLTTFGMSCTFMGQHLANQLRRLPDDMMSVARLLHG